MFTLFVLTQISLDRYRRLYLKLKFTYLAQGSPIRGQRPPVIKRSPEYKTCPKKWHLNVFGSIKVRAFLPSQADNIKTKSLRRLLYFSASCTLQTYCTQIQRCSTQIQQFIFICLLTMITVIFVISGHNKALLYLQT